MSSMPIQDGSAQIAARAFAAADPGRDATQLLKQARADAASPDKAAQTHDAAKRLEAVFSTMLIKELRGPQSALFGEGTSADVYGGWFDQYLGEVLAKRGALHLADSIEHSLARKEAPSP
jgi:Rod binding domain-containing protein